jgi:hypothetical protein
MATDIDPLAASWMYMELDQGLDARDYEKQKFRNFF